MRTNGTAVLETLDIRTPVVALRPAVGEFPIGRHRTVLQQILTA